MNRMDLGPYGTSSETRITVTYHCSFRVGDWIECDGDLSRVVRVDNCTITTRNIRWYERLTLWLVRSVFPLQMDVWRP